ncbi:hypothetical protein Acr_17g0003480 [Actinidia rufa]|uniref:Aminotransferase-like plant mobile domain-containing protein n=1 Tax=Actinidia rufa TaxID=165716 RepID=A0A7J0G1W7_9ERIC|nr:hypothetical protein Acr_17g0003480 [Actinidia rufa]
MASPTTTTTAGGAHVSIAYLPLLKDIAEIKSYAWGAAILVNLHSAFKKVLVGRLDRASYFFALRPIANDYWIVASTIEGSVRFPLVFFWAGALAKSIRNNHNCHKKEHWAGLLYNIGCYDASILLLSHTSGLLAGVLFLLLCQNSSLLGGLGRSCRSGPKIGKDWVAFKAYKDYNDTWNQRRSLFIDFHGGSNVKAGGSSVAANSSNVASFSNHTTPVEQQLEVESANVASQGSPRSPSPYRPHQLFSKNQKFYMMVVSAHIHSSNNT